MCCTSWHEGLFGNESGGHTSGIASSAGREAAAGLWRDWPSTGCVAARGHAPCRSSSSQLDRQCWACPQSLGAEPGVDVLQGHAPRCSLPLLTGPGRRQRECAGFMLVKITQAHEILSRAAEGQGTGLSFASRRARAAPHDQEADGWPGTHLQQAEGLGHRQRLLQADGFVALGGFRRRPRLEAGGAGPAWRWHRHILLCMRCQ